MGFSNRGVTGVVTATDQMLFDPATVIDDPTPQDPSALGGGIDRVWVNRVLVSEGGQETGAHPGRCIAGSGSERAL